MAKIEQVFQIDKIFNLSDRTDARFFIKIYIRILKDELYSVSNAHTSTKI